MRYLLAALISVCAFFAQAQQINPVPDYVFGNRMSVGRTSVTDTAAYFSVGPRYGAIRGMMPPMVVDTASVSGNKRNGLLIFSVQKNKFLYWDSVRVQWSDMAGSSGSYIVAGDTASMLLPYLRKADTTAMLAPYLKESDTVFLSNRVNLKVNISDTATMLAPYLKESDTVFLSNRINLKVNISDTSSMLTNYVRHAGYGLTKSGQAFLVDTAAMATRARVQKGIDSVAVAGLTGSGTTNYVAKFTGTKALGNSQIFDNGTRVGIGTASPGFKVHAVGTSEGYLVSEATNKAGGAGIIAFSRNADSTRQAGAVYFVPSTTTPYISLSGDGSQVHLAVTGAGDVGIGNVAPAYKLDVTGTLRNTTGAAFATSSGSVLIGTTTDAGYKTDIAGTLRSTLGANFATTSGNVGIGTASPSRLLDIQSTSSSAVFRLKGGTSNDQGSAIYYTFAGSTSTYMAIGDRAAIFGGKVDSLASIFTNSTIPLIFDIGASEKARFNTSGELLIGTASDAGAYALQVAGSIYNTTGAVLAASSGEVLIGTTTDAGDYKLQVNGNERIAGKLDVITTTEYGVNLGRSGTSATAFQAYNSTAAMAVGIESSAGGGLFTGTSAYAAVFGNANNYPTQFVTNNAVRATISAAGELLIGSTTNTANGEILQVSGRSYFSQEVTIGMVDAGTYAASLVVKGPVFFVNNQSSSLKGLYLDTTVLAISNTTNVAPITVTGSSFTGNNGGDILNLQSTWNTTANMNGIYMLVTNTASGASSNFLNLTDNTNTFKVTKAAEIVTSAPTGGSVRKWKLGEAATVSPTSPNRTIRVEIDGTVYYLHAKTTND